MRRCLKRFLWTGLGLSAWIRGTKVWPQGNPDTYWSDHWCCRFESNADLFTADHVIKLLAAAEQAGFDVIKTEGLYTFNGERGYSLAQGE